jgi:hypothetical protein
MSPKLPIVAQPGAATRTTVARETGQPANIRRKAYASAQRESRRVSAANQYKIFVGYSSDIRASESLLKPEIGWCERHCAGLWSILYGSYTKGLGYDIRFGFTNQEDAQAFARWREERKRREEERRDFPGS